MLDYDCWASKVGKNDNELAQAGEYGVGVDGGSSLISSIGKDR